MDYLKIKLSLIIFLISFLLPTTIYAQQSEKQDSVAIYVVSHGWRTGLVLPTERLSDPFFAETKEYNGSINLEIGWGDLDFYQSPDVDYLITVKAALWPTTSTLHVVRIDTTAEAYFPYSDLIRLNFTIPDFDMLQQFVINSFAQDSLGKPIPLDKGIYGQSTFYLGEEKYYFPKTCNVWTAQALKEAGLPVRPLYSQKAETLMGHIKKYGKVIRLRDEDD